MKTIEELRAYYETDLLPTLTVLDRARKKVLLGLFVGIVISVIAPIIALYFSFGSVVLMAICFPVWIGVIIYLSISTGKYKKSFKVGIIEQIVRAIDPNLSYDASKAVNKSHFTHSELFKKSWNEYKGDDYVQGMVGKTSLEFSEVHAQHVSTDSEGRRQASTVFKGLFLVADFNKSFQGKTFVLPDTAEKLFGSIGSMLQSWNAARGELVKMEDVAFEKEFVVYGDDQIEARYILSTSLMERILAYKKKSNRPVRLSFIGNNVHVAISYKKSLFEPRIFRSLLNFRPIQEYFEDLSLAIDLVEDLNLNTRIWTKD
ncbi:MAG: Galanin [Saprospirales bacterium]|nr:Galanin [Saprospirales bacterium]